MASSSGFYAGSQLLIPLASMMRVSVDQINFTVCQIACVGLGFLLRKRMSVLNVSAELRYVVEVVLGILLLVFCFGHQLLHLFAHAGVSYLIMRFSSNPSRMPLFIFGYTMGYLAICHILRQIYDYGGYTLDITGPLMIQTQKLTSLAFSYADGKRMVLDASFGRTLTENQRRHAVTKMPSVLQFVSYCFYFHGSLLGPFINYADYTHFIESHELATLLSDPKIARELNHRTARCVFMSGVFLSLHILVASRLSVTMVEDEETHAWSFPFRLIYAHGVLSIFRSKYYFAWSITEAVNLAAGLGYSGFNEKTKRHEWLLSNNFNWRYIEFGNSIKVVLDGWNISTTRWLRDTLYDRLPARYRVVGVFFVSAFWHGFYPGYYLVFLSFAGFTIAARTVRKYVRPLFVPSSSPSSMTLLDANWKHKSVSHIVYDIITTLSSMLMLSYGVTPFLLLELPRSIALWRSFFFYGHIGSVFIILILPRVAKLFKPQVPRPGTDDNTDKVKRS